MVLRGLEAGEKVVVAADTAGIAEEVVAVMRLIGALDGKKALVITRTTERDADAIEFMENVNVGAAQYDLVAYNSAMAGTDWVRCWKVWRRFLQQRQLTSKRSRSIQQESKPITV